MQGAYRRLNGSIHAQNFGRSNHQPNTGREVPQLLGEVFRTDWSDIDALAVVRGQLGIAT